jgi:hypothetical protein
LLAHLLGNVDFSLILVLQGTHGALALERLANRSPIGMKPDEHRFPDVTLFGSLQTRDIIFSRMLVEL